MMIPRAMQNTGHPGFVAADQAYDCQKCIAHHSQSYAFPMLEPEDFEAWNIFLLLQDQQRIGMDIIGLDYSVLPAVFDLLGIQYYKRRWLFEQLVVLNHAFTAHRAEKREQENRANELRRGTGMTGHSG